jgi:uncharacterized ferredoxin-like protein
MEVTMTRIAINEWPPNSPPDLAKKENVLIVARLMANAALTAPVSGGVPSWEAEIAHGETEIELIAREMERLAHHGVPKKLKKTFLYQAAMIRESDAILFLGTFRARSTPMDVGCGLCGGEPDCSFFYERANQVDGVVDDTDRERTTAINGPLCMLRVHDLGYAVGSALWIASTHLVDAMPSYPAGLAGRNLDFCMNSEVVVGIPVGVLAKNPFVDISPDYHMNNMRKMVDGIRRWGVIPRQLAMVNMRHHDPTAAKAKKTKK